ncbi:MAG: Holliday junction resolvase RuvX [Gammaproteobacteria bacterium]|nr:Holliday junction resolvase RuvX [Gammaproteobacteria bacterium]
MGFDYGKKRIGVAIGQTLTATASPLQTVRVLNSGPDWQTIHLLIQTWQPDALAVGLPLREDRSESHSTRGAEHFTRQLKSRFQLPIYRVDEYLSSHAAAERVGNRTPLDPVAAQIILETWFSTRNNGQLSIVNG